MYFSTHLLLQERTKPAEPSLRGVTVGRLPRSTDKIFVKLSKANTCSLMGCQKVEAVIMISQEMPD